MPHSRTRMIAVYAVGQFGWSLASYGVLNLLAYFYMPLTEQDGQVLFPSFIFQGSVLAGLTIIGLIGAGGRLFDAITDPIIANWSDRSKSRFGRRRVFLLFSALPLAFFSAAVFYPPFANIGSGNVIWLGLSVTLFYLFLTLYVVPYNALIAELGRTAKERLNIATAISVTWALGFAVGSQIYLLQNVLEAQMEPAAAFQRSILLFSAIAALAMLLPAIFLNEKKYTQPLHQGAAQTESTQATVPNARQSFRRVWTNHNFRWFALSDFLYWLALTFIQMGIAYYVVDLMGKDKAYASTFMILVFGLSFICYIPVNLAASRWGKRRVVLAAFGFFGGAFAITAILNLGGIPIAMLVIVLQVLAAVALACFGILPNAIVGDMADAHSRQAGESLAGMYFAVRTLVMKAGTSAAMLIFPTFLLWGEPGIRASAIAALIFCLSGFLAFRQYREPIDNQNITKS
jgi:glycoside/pentoside/hexuronide:cation symporter, GPH family